MIRKLPGFYLIRLFLAGSVLASGLQAAARQKAGATLSSYERTLRVLDAGIEALGGLALESGGMPPVIEINRELTRKVAELGLEVETLVAVHAGIMPWRTFLEATGVAVK